MHVEPYYGEPIRRVRLCTVYRNKNTQWFWRRSFLPFRSSDSGTCVSKTLSCNWKLFLTLNSPHFSTEINFKASSLHQLLDCSQCEDYSTVNSNCSFTCSLHLQHNSFGAAVRLAKRWLASQMLLRHYITEEAVELLVASLYISPEPFTSPRWVNWVFSY